MPEIFAECYFLDVGQGAAQVIDLRDGSAIVIDCGPSYPVLGDLLNRRLKIQRIAALILSHNHHDHVGGATGLVRHFRKAIGRIYFLQDKPPAEMQDLKYYKYLKTEYDAGHIPAPIPLIRHQEHRWLYSSAESTDAVRLEILFPDFFQNIEAQKSKKQNHTCGVLLLRCGDRKVLFPGDAEIDAWKAIHRTREGRSIECDVIAVPHHGGQIVRNKRPGESYEELHDEIAGELQWLYTKAIRCQHAVVSAGTSNSYPDQHPLPPQIQAVCRSGAAVLCTQITERCCNDLESLHPGVLTPQVLPGQSQATSLRTTSGARSSVACAGTVLVQIGPNEIHIDRLQEHQQAIDAKLRATAHPLCRN